MAERRWISCRECMEYLGLKNVQTVYQKFYRGEIPGGRVGRTVRIDWKSLEQQLEKGK
jgi:excisionase family DNA binding protein